jgi:ribosomal protein S27AE
MNHDDKKIPKFSVVQECPKCGQLTLSFKANKIVCSNCGYEENVPAIK